jgi:hypothetical protein
MQIPKTTLRIRDCKGKKYLLIEQPKMKAKLRKESD